MRPVLPWSLLRHTLLLEQGKDLRVEQFIGFEHLEWNWDSGLGTSLGVKYKFNVSHAAAQYYTTILCGYNQINSLQLTSWCSYVNNHAPYGGTMIHHEYNKVYREFLLLRIYLVIQCFISLAFCFAIQVL